MPSLTFKIPFKKKGIKVDNNSLSAKPKFDPFEKTQVLSDGSLLTISCEVDEDKKKIVCKTEKKPANQKAVTESDKSKVSETEAEAQSEPEPESEEVEDLTIK